MQRRAQTAFAAIVAQVRAGEGVVILFWNGGG